MKRFIYQVTGTGYFHPMQRNQTNLSGNGPSTGHPGTRNKAIDEISAALKNDVANILRTHMPELQGLDRDAAYQCILDQPEILDASFRFFRARPEFFHSVVVGRDLRPIQSDSSPLRCGRSISEIIGMVLRASARRYFRCKLDHRQAKQPLHSPALGGLIARWAGGKKKPSAKSPSQADKLFISIRDFLIYEWQALMIPVYCALTPDFVTSLGPHILSLRDPSQLLAMSKVPDSARWGIGNRPLLLDNADRLMSKGDHETIDSEILYRVAQMMRLDKLFPEENRIKLIRKALARIVTTSPDAVNLMMPVLGHDIRQFVTFLFVAYLSLGDTAYAQVMGRGANCRRLAGWLERIETLPSPTLIEMKSVFEEIMTSGVT